MEIMRLELERLQAYALDTVRIIDLLALEIKRQSALNTLREARLKASMVVGTVHFFSQQLELEERYKAGKIPKR